jgi:hypothetical protein
MSNLFQMTNKVVLKERVSSQNYEKTTTYSFKQNLKVMYL